MRRRLAAWMVMLGFGVAVSVATAINEQYSHTVARCGRGCNEAWTTIPLSTIVTIGAGIGLIVLLLMVIGKKLRLGARLVRATRRVLLPAPARGGARATEQDASG